MYPTIYVYNKRKASDHRHHGSTNTITGGKNLNVPYTNRKLI